MFYLFLIRSNPVYVFRSETLVVNYLLPLKQRIDVRISNCYQKIQKHRLTKNFIIFLLGSFQIKKKKFFNQILLALFISLWILAFNNQIKYLRLFGLKIECLLEYYF